MQRYDVVVVGAGPGGYVAAIRCAQLGMSTAVVEQWRDPDGGHRLGGTCLNVGCIPSKAMLDSSEKFSQLKNEFAHHGINAKGVSLDLGTMLERKDKIVSGLTRGVESLFLKNKITWHKGTGRLLDNKTVQVISDDEKGDAKTISANHIIIATGSKPRALPNQPFDKNLFIDSTDALSLTEVPRHLLVIGGGVIGLELGSVWSRLGAKVTVLVRGSQLLGKADAQLADEATKMLTSQGLDIRFNTKATDFNATKSGVTVKVVQDGKIDSIKVDKVLVSIGREPNTTGLNCNEVGLNMTEQGFIDVDEYCQTNVGGIYAIGDVVRGPMLAHKASEEGVMVAERISGQKSHVNYLTVPWVIYTFPEIAWVGYTPQELDEKGISYKTGTYPFRANGRALAMGTSGGFVKLISDEKTDRLLGAHIIGPNASEMISEAVLAMEFDASAEDIARTMHAHPTLSEAFHEAALGVDKRMIHF